MKFKITYLAYNQIGNGKEDWDLYFNEDDGRPYYKNKLNNEIIYASDKKYTFTNKFNKNNGNLEFVNNDTGDIRSSEPKNAKDLWEIIQIDKLIPLPELNVELIKIEGQELDNFIKNNNLYNINWRSEFENVNFWLGHGSNNVLDKSKKIYTPNRFFLKGTSPEQFSIIPIYLDKINNNSRLIDDIKKRLNEIILHYENDDMLDSFRYKEAKANLKYLDNLIDNHKDIWLSIAKFDIIISIKDKKLYVHIPHAWSDYLVPGGGKIIICFLIKYLKQKYSDLELQITLSASGGSGKVWQTYGFEKNNNIFTGHRESATHILNLDQFIDICNEITLKKFNINKMLYYDTM